MTGRLFFLLLILISSTLWYFIYNNPIPLFINFCILALCILSISFALYGRIIIFQRSKFWNFTIPSGLIKFGGKAVVNLRFDKPYWSLFTIFPSLKHNISPLVASANIREFQIMENKKLAIAVLENLPPGSYQFKSLLIYSYDYFGFFRFRKKIQLKLTSKAAANLTVLPDVNETAHQYPEKYQDHTDIKHKPIIHNELSLLESKLFEPSDDARRIIWKRYARSDILMIRTREKQNHYIQRVQITIDPILPSEQLRFKIPKLGKYLQNMHWQRIKERAAYRLYQLWQNDIPLSIVIAGMDRANQELIAPLESGNIFFLQKMLFIVNSLPLVKKDRLKPLAKKSNNQKIWLISGRNLAGVDDYVELWESGHRPGKKKLISMSHLFSDLKGVSLIRKIFFKDEDRFKPVINSVLLRFFLLVLKIKDLSK